MSEYSKAGSRELWRGTRWGLESMGRIEVIVFLTGERGASETGGMGSWDS